MQYSQAELRERFPVYDLADARFASWLLTDDNARVSYSAVGKLVADILLKLAFAAFEGREPEDV